MTRKKKTVKCNCDPDIPSLKEQYEDIMNNFDFKHVQMMMSWDKARANYDWDGNHTGYEPWKTAHFNYKFNPDTHSVEHMWVPTEQELKEQASEYLLKLIEYIEKHPREKYHYTATGPFKYTYRWGIIELECVFHSWSCD